MLRLVYVGILLSVLSACRTASVTPPETSQPLAMIAASAAASAPVEIKILAINDFHGHLKPSGTLTMPDPSDASKTINVVAGGSEYLATWIKTLKAKNPNNIVVAAGDLIGASPLLSALFHDEPTIEAMNALGLELNAVGNHEFDDGQAELLRMQKGGCHPVEGCQMGGVFAGAKFKFLAANVVDDQSGQTLFPAYQVKTFGGVKVGFIGLTLRGTPGLVAQTGIAGLSFNDEATTINAQVPTLKTQGVEAIVVLIHEGGRHSGGLNECQGVSGAIVGIVNRLDPAIDVVISGHTHQAYQCRINGKLVTSAYQYGRVISEIDLTLDPVSHDVINSRANNVIVSHDVAKDAVQSAIIGKYDVVTQALENRVVGKVAGILSKTVNAAGESTLGDVIADSQLAATASQNLGAAQIALVNPGGIRADLIPNMSSELTYGQLFTAQPFANALVTLTLTGAELIELLEQQFTGYSNQQPYHRILQLSHGFSYRYDATLPPGQRVDRASVQLNGKPIAPTMNYRLTVNHFLAAGGDGFRILAQGRDRMMRVKDIDALERYLQANTPLATPALNRVTRIK